MVREFHTHVYDRAVSSVVRLNYATVLQVKKNSSREINPADAFRQVTANVLYLILDFEATAVFSNSVHELTYKIECGRRKTQRAKEVARNKKERQLQREAFTLRSACTAQLL